LHSSEHKFEPTGGIDDPRTFLEGAVHLVIEEGRLGDVRELTRLNPGDAPAA
jgi:hypothetical protein